MNGNKLTGSPIGCQKDHDEIDAACMKIRARLGSWIKPTTGLSYRGGDARTLREWVEGMAAQLGIEEAIERIAASCETSKLRGAPLGKKKAKRNLDRALAPRPVETKRLGLHEANIRALHEAGQRIREQQRQAAIAQARKEREDREFEALMAEIKATRREAQAHNRRLDREHQRHQARMSRRGALSPFSQLE